MNYANPQIEELFLNFEMSCDKAIDYMKGEFAVMRAGRANPKLVEKIKVDSYGAMTPINQMGNITSPEPRQLVITLWDKGALKDVEKAILQANSAVRNLSSRSRNLPRTPRWCFATAAATQWTH